MSPRGRRTAPHLRWPNETPWRWRIAFAWLRPLTRLRRSGFALPGTETAHPTCVDDLRLLQQLPGAHPAYLG